MRHLLEIAGTGLAAVLLHRLRSLVCVAALVAVLLPYLAVLGLAKGVEAEAEASARFGADLYVSGSQFGRPAPVPLEAAEQVRRIEGVTDVVPRIVGEAVLGIAREHAVLVGLPPERFSAWADCVDGSVPGPPHPFQPNELVLGTALARRLNIKVGDHLPPFYSNDRGVRVSQVVGVFKPDAPLWQARLVLTTFETAAQVFDQPGLATDLLVWCRPGYEAAVTRTIMQGLSLSGSEGSSIRPRVSAREDLLVRLPAGPRHLEGIFTLHFVLAFVVGILVLLVTSGLGLAERRREIGILKATGWQTDEVLLRGLAESFSLSLAGACVSLLLAWVWLRGLNGYGLAGLFLTGAGTAPEFAVPFRLAPVPALLAFLLAFVVVLSGTLYSCWRAATVSPLEAMR
jgi:ABC-type lipoprotein release transport system permease subunit